MLLRNHIRNVTADWNSIVHDDRMDPNTPFWISTFDHFLQISVSNENLSLINTSRKIFSILLIETMIPLLSRMEWVMLDAGDELGPYAAPFRKN